MDKTWKVGFKALVKEIINDGKDRAGKKGEDNLRSLSTEQFLNAIDAGEVTGGDVGREMSFQGNSLKGATLGTATLSKAVHVEGIGMFTKKRDALFQDLPSYAAFWDDVMSDKMKASVYIQELIQGIQKAESTMSTGFAEIDRYINLQEKLQDFTLGGGLGDDVAPMNKKAISAKKREAFRKDERKISILLSTLQFLLYFGPVPKSTLIMKKVLRNWQGTHTGMEDITGMRTSMVIDAFAQLYCELDQPIKSSSTSYDHDRTSALAFLLVNDAAFIDTHTVPAILGLSTMPSAEASAAMGSRWERASIECSMVQTKFDYHTSGFPFAYLRLRELVLKGGRHAFVVYENILMLLQRIHPCFLKNPAEPPFHHSTVLSLLHMFGEFLRLSPIVETIYLKRALSVVAKYQTWPKPFGAMASKLKDMLEGEIKLPGTALLQHVLSFMPMLTEDGEQLSAFANKMKRGASAMGPSPKQKFASELNMWNDLRNSVTLFMSDTEPKAALLSSLVDEAKRKGPYGFVTEGDAVLPTGFEVSYMRAHLLNFMLKADIDLPRAKDPVGLLRRVGTRKKAEVRKVADWFCRARQIAFDSQESILSRGGVTGRDLRTYEWEKILQEIDPNTKCEARLESNIPTLARMLPEKPLVISKRTARASTTTRSTGSSLMLPKVPTKLPLDSTCSVVEGGVVPRLPPMSANNFVFESIDDKYGIDLPGNPSSRTSSGSFSSTVSRGTGGGSAVSGAPGKRSSNLSLKGPKRGISSMQDSLHRRFSIFGGLEKYSFLKYGTDTDDLMRKAVQAVRPVVPASALAEAEEESRLEAGAEGDSIFRSRTGSAAATAEAATPGKALTASLAGSSRTGTSARSSTFEEDEQKKARPEKLRVCLVGGMNNVHRFLCAYIPLVYMEDEKPELKELDLEVYLIPFEVNDLAAYIAQHDTWYRRQVFFPFSDAFNTAPSPLHEDLFRASASRARAERVMGTLKSGTARTPLSLYPSLVTDYVRSARHIFPFFVWICECWVAEERGSSRRGAATVAVPFCSGVSIGLKTAMKRFLQKKAQKKASTLGSGGDSVSKSQSRPMSDRALLGEVSGSMHELESEDFVASWKIAEQPALSVKLDCLGDDGSQTSLPLDKYFSLQMQAVPNYAEGRSSVRKGTASSYGVAPDPKAPTLLCSSVVNSEDIQHRLKKCKEKGYRYVRDMMRANSLDLEVEGAHVQAAHPRFGFNVDIDGKSLGPCWQIQISLARRPDGTPVTLPVKTVFPIE